MVEKFSLFELGMLVWLGVVIYGIFTVWTFPLTLAIAVLTLIMNIHMYRKKKTNPTGK